MENNTTLDYILKKYNLKNDKLIQLPIPREELGQLFKELNFNRGAEIGVEQGIYSEELCKANPNLWLHCVDAWKAYKGYRDHTNQDKLNRYFEETTQRLAPYNCDIIRGWSMDIVRHFKDNSLDFVYIDGNHDFKNCTDDIAEWSKKVRKGGIIAGHDYVKRRTSIECQVMDVINAWVHAYGITPLFVTNDEFTTWLYVK